MSFHFKFIALNAAAVALALAKFNPPTAVKGIILDAVAAIPGDGPIEVEAIGHLAVKSDTAPETHRFSYGSSITSLKVQPVMLEVAPAPVLEPEPQTEAKADEPVEEEADPEAESAAA